MSLSTTSIKRPVFTIVVNLILILFGVIGYTFLGIREYPSIDPAIVSVSTSYSGANADIIESQITEPLEKAINSIDGIRNISSSSNQGSSNITVEFNLDKNLEEAANDVRDALNRENVELPSGKITGKNTELTVRTLGNLSTEEQFNNLIVKTDGDK